MNIKNIIANEKARIQALFEPYNEKGSDLTLVFPGGSKADYHAIHKWAVLKVLPRFDAEGNLLKTDFVVLFLTSYFMNDPHQGAHSFLCVSATPAEYGAFELLSDEGVKFIITPLSDEDSQAAWDEWRAYMKAHPAVLQGEQEAIAEHTDFARQYI